MTVENVNDYLYTWNEGRASEHLKTVRIDDDIRDGMQAAFIKRPTLEQRKTLLDHTIKVGTQGTVIGFPFVSEQEFQDCQAIIKHGEEQGYEFVATFLSRVAISDVEPIVQLSKGSSLDVRAEMFMGGSTIRRKVESWDLDNMIGNIETVTKYLRDNNTGFGMSIEDSTRTPPKDLERLIRAMLDAGTMSLAICDTVGDSTPDGAARITEFFLEQMARSGREVEIFWHGHNDKGLAVANAIASAKAGAHTISGTFLGIGERTGNTPLEQVLMVLYQAGNRLYDMEAIYPYCQTLSKYTDTPIPFTSPIVGKQAFATGAGTHSAAVLKARKLGRGFEDMIFAGVPAEVLGREQDVVIGPTSGRYNAQYMLEQVGVPATDELTNQLLAYAKSKDTWMTGEEIRRYVNTLT